MQRMWKTGLLAFAMVALVCGDSVSQETKTAASVAAEVGKTIGAANVKSIQYSGTGYAGFNFSCKPGGPWAKFKLTSYTRVIDYEKGASQQAEKWAQYTKTCGAGFQPVMGSISDVQSLNGDVAWSFGGPGPDNAPPDGAPAPGAVEERKLEMALTPYGWVKAVAAAQNPTMETKTVDGKELTVVSFFPAGKRKLSGYVDAQHLLVRTDFWANNDMLGDSATVTLYSDYKDFSGIKVPMKIQRMSCYGNNFQVKFSEGEGLPGCMPQLDLMVSDVQLNMPTHVDVPNSIRQAMNNRGEGGGEGGRGVQSQKIADGVWVLAGGGTQSLAVEFKDYAVVVEASGNEARSLAVIAETKRLIPNKPIQYVVNSHHHLDHAGGLRTYVAEGSTIITNEINKPFYEQIFQYPHTLRPDKLAQNPKPAMFITVKDKYVLTDGDRSLELDREQGQEHDEGLMMVYLPNSKVLFPSDAFMLDHAHPGTRTTLGMGQNLLDNVKRLKLDVAQVVPVHSATGVFAVSFEDAKKRIIERHGDGN